MREREEMAACALCCFTKNVLCSRRVHCGEGIKALHSLGGVPRGAWSTPRCYSRSAFLWDSVRLLYALILGIGLLFRMLQCQSSFASVSELIQLSTIIIFFVALAEERFRVIRQLQLIDRSSAVVGIPITSVILGAMHAGYANVYELLFATVAGVFLGVGSTK